MNGFSAPIILDDDELKYPGASGTAEGAAIMMYHGLDEAFGFNPESFRVQMQYLADNGFNTITLDHLASWIETGTPDLPEKPVVITFDDDYITVYTVAYPALQQHGFVGINYAHTNYVGVAGSNDHCDWFEIIEMENAGVIFTESHTRTHRNLTSLSADDMVSELAGSKADIELNIPGKVCRHHAYPYGGYDSSVLEMVETAGYTSAVTTISGLATRGSDLLELPRFAVNPNPAGAGTALNSGFMNVVNAFGGSTGQWTESTSEPGYLGDGYRYATAGSGDREAFWDFTNVAPGRHELFARWTAHPNRASNTPYTITHAEGRTTVRVNQRLQGNQWVSLGIYTIDSTTVRVIISNDADGIVIADGVMLELQTQPDQFVVY